MSVDLVKIVLLFLLHFDSEDFVLGPKLLAVAVVDHK
jgi:hypothetical protein